MLFDLTSSLKEELRTKKKSLDNWGRPRKQGKKGGAADQAKGDGTVDIKGDSKYVTVA